MSLVNIYKFMLLRKQKQGKNQNSQIFEKSFFSLKYVSSLWKFYRNESCALKKIFYRNKSCALKKIFDRNKSCTLKKICKFLLLFLASYMNGMSEINLILWALFIWRQKFSLGSWFLFIISLCIFIIIHLTSVQCTSVEQPSHF
jgi:hypothetical protein